MKTHSFKYFTAIIFSLFLCNFALSDGQSVDDRLILDIDASGEVDAMTDGLLIMRSMFGFTDEVLVDGAVAEDCGECDMAKIQEHISIVKSASIAQLNSPGMPGPEGPQGEKGDTGEQGAKGNAGADGAGMTLEQADAIAINTMMINEHVGYVQHLGLGKSSSTALAGNTATITSDQASAIATNTAKSGITSSQATAIAANTTKTGISSDQAIAIAANTAAIEANTTILADWVLTTQTVTSANGRVWMDRNLGASQVATSLNDSDAYGNLFQWGRSADGHEVKTSNITEVRSIDDYPPNGDFIESSSDWRNTPNPELWQGVNGINNVCPFGYRLPTKSEWQAEQASWSSIDASGAFASPLKLTLAGYRSNSGWSSVSYGMYWSSSVSEQYTDRLRFNGDSSQVSPSHRGSGHSVRCIQDLVAGGSSTNGTNGSSGPQGEKGDPGPQGEKGDGTGQQTIAQLETALRTYADCSQQGWYWFFPAGDPNTVLFNLREVQNGCAVKFSNDLRNPNL